MDTIAKKATVVESITIAFDVDKAITSSNSTDTYLIGKQAEAKTIAQKMSDGLAVEKVNKITALADHADALRDDLLSAFIFFLKGYLAWKQEGALDAAKRLFRIVENHGGNFGRVSRDVESGLYNSLLNEMEKPESVADLATLNLTPLVAQMKVAQGNYEKIMQDHALSANDKAGYVAPIKLKGELLNVLNEMVAYLIAMQKANAAVYKPLATQVGVFVDALNQRIKQRTSSKPEVPPTE